jgi:hypothetical protein
MISFVGGYFDLLSVPTILLDAPRNPHVTNIRVASKDVVAG